MGRHPAVDKRLHDAAEGDSFGACGAAGIPFCRFEREEGLGVGMKGVDWGFRVGLRVKDISCKGDY